MGKLVRKRYAELFAAKLRAKDRTTEKVNCGDDFRPVVEDFSDIFVDELPKKLSPKRELYFEINLKSDEPPPVRPVIRLSSEEIKELKKQLQGLLSKGSIQPSSSPYAALVIFVKNKSDELGMVYDYRAVNKITIPYSNPLPLLSEMIDQVSGSVIFSHLDLIGAYHQMRIVDKDIHKTAIRTRFGSFGWKVLCFGLTNAPASFSRLMSSMLRELNGEFLVQYLDDVLVYSKSFKENKLHLPKLIQVLRKNKIC